MMSLIEKLGWTMKRLLPTSIFRMFRNAYKRLRSVTRFFHRSQETALRHADLCNDLRKAGFGSGDVVMVHSALSQIGKLERGALDVVESFIELLGPQGTIIMPTYGSVEDFLSRHKRGELLDLRTEKSATGKITEVFRQYSGVQRSSHPFSSCSAWGKEATYVVSDHHTDSRICHRDSPISRFLALKGTLVGLGISLAPVSFYHLLEDARDDFPFRTQTPSFRAKYIDPAGGSIERDICRYDPDVAKTRIETPAGAWVRNMITRHMEEKGILTRFIFGRAHAWKMPATFFYEELVHLKNEGITIYSTEDQWKEGKDRTSLRKEAPWTTG